MNLGTKGCEAARALSTSEQFVTIVQAIKDQANSAANSALDASHDQQSRQCGYARALRDLYVALESARAGVPQPQVKKPGVKE